MKKRALILAVTMAACVSMWGSSEGRVSAETAGALPIKALTGKVVEKNPYMADSDANIHHDCYNTDSTDEILPVGIYSEINVSYEKTNANASPAIFFDSYGHAVVPPAWRPCHPGY